MRWMSWVLWLGLAWPGLAAGADLEAGLRAAERRDWAAALAQFRPLAEQGVAAAQVNLGNLYMKGLGVTQDYTAAYRWYLKAAEQGDALGQNKLGLLHYYGLGVPEDAAEAARWFGKAAEQGETGAQALLGSMYAMGDGVARDRARAYLWYTLAAEHGHPDAQTSRDKLVEEMSPGEIGEALDLLAARRKREEDAAPGKPAGNGAPSAKPERKGKSQPPPKKTAPAHREHGKGNKS
jgi:TPR repeat protein